MTKQSNHWKSGVVIKMIRYFDFLTKVCLYLISPKALYLNLFYFKFICISGSFDCSVWYLFHVSKSFIYWFMSVVIPGQNTDSLARSMHLVSVQGGQILVKMKFPVFSLSFPCITKIFPVLFLHKN